MFCPSTYSKEMFDVFGKRFERSAMPFRRALGIVSESRLRDDRAAARFARDHRLQTQAGKQRPDRRCLEPQMFLLDDPAPERHQ